MTSHRFVIGFALIILLAAGGCLKRSTSTGGGNNGGDPARPDNPGRASGDAAGLKAYCEELQKAIQSNDVKKAAAMTRSLMPDEARLRKAYRDDTPPGTIQKTLAFHKQMVPPTDDGWARALAAKPGQNVVAVHGATTEEIAQYAPNSVAFKEFPQAAKTVAQQLRPGMTFYEVEFLEPGKDAGMKFHLFYWDGSQWAMLGQVWRGK